MSSWKNYSTFPVTIINVKESGKIGYFAKAPQLEYYQNDPNSCCISSSESAFIASGEIMIQGLSQ